LRTAFEAQAFHAVYGHIGIITRRVDPAAAANKHGDNVADVQLDRHAKPGPACATTTTAAAIKRRLAIATTAATGAAGEQIDARLRDRNRGIGGDSERPLHACRDLVDYPPIRPERRQGG